jgi:hypothetical protein
MNTLVKSVPMLLSITFLSSFTYVKATEVEMPHGSPNPNQNKRTYSPKTVQRQTPTRSMTGSRLQDEERGSQASNNSQLKVHGLLKDQLDQILTQSQLTSLDVSSSQIIDQELLLVGQHLLKLRALNVSDSPITNEGLKTLGALTDQELLNLSGTKVNSDGLEFVLEFPKLQEINLTRIILSKNFLDRLSSKRGLKVIYDKQNVF